MSSFLPRTILNILAGYVRILIVIISVLLRIILLAFFSFLIVFPQWYFAMHYKFGYNIFLAILFLSIILFAVGVKIAGYFKSEFKKETKTGYGIPVFLRFIILISELYLIRYLLLSDRIIFAVPGILMAYEFFFFLCLIKGNKEILISWMNTLLICLTSFEILYAVSVLFTRGNSVFAVFLGVIFVFAIGYLLYNPGMFKNIKPGKR